MKVKKYVGKNMQDTIFKIKAELGSDAIILNTRKFKEGGFFGFFGKEKIEVLAGVEENEQQAKKAAPAGEDDQVNQAGSNRDIEELKRKIDELNRSWQQDDFVRRLDDYSQKLYNHLLEEGVKKELVCDIIEDVSSGEDNKDKLEILQSTVRKQLGEAREIEIENPPHTVAMVGPTGVGKTTTIAKLAAFFAKNPKKRVGLVTADTYRVAAVEQLKTYSDIINIPLEVVYSKEEFASTMAGDFRNFDIVFVDTPGSSWDDKLQLGRIEGILDGELLDEIHLLLSLNQKLENISKVYERFSRLNPDRILLTKLDEAAHHGDLLNIRLWCDLPYSYYSYGQDVPEDLNSADPENLLPYLLGDYNV
ncbi:flagellar biosynthesis protein FlhF [Halarsenatibacter silvermanii]|uniref:Flagellar biosynthesis protein FlhF n=1 Tax=Halarsenatibacter silvermanii TaxID=321763 RepID=A0A1G9MJA3_9FIRM|nr:flagellar biosynthesis protein FlhF [Halarsenatibacter silvermanii]SDL74360.1 flagellar biosynthesis protein FlhF [Halarsenatibacter silvermanii]